MPKFEIQDLHVDCVSHDYTRAAIGWNDKAAGERLHIWVNVEPVSGAATPQDTTIHVNSIEQDASKPGYFKHRTRDQKSAAQRPLVEEIFRQVRSKGLVLLAVIKQKATEREEEEQRQRQIAENRKRAAGVELYDALKAARDQLQAIVIRMEAASTPLAISAKEAWDSFYSEGTKETLAQIDKVIASADSGGA